MGHNLVSRTNLIGLCIKYATNTSSKERSMEKRKEAREGEREGTKNH